MAKRYNVSEEIYPLRVEAKEFELEGKRSEEIFTELLNDVPSYLALYMNRNKQEWLKKDMAEVYRSLMELRGQNEKLIFQYQKTLSSPHIPEDEKTNYGIKVRTQRPDIDVALNLEGRVGTVRTREAYLMLINKAEENSIPFEALPAVTAWVKKSQGK